METANGEVANEVTESNHMPEPPAPAQPDFSKQTLGMGHDSNSLNLSEPMAS